MKSVLLVFSLAISWPCFSQLGSISPSNVVSVCPDDPIIYGTTGGLSCAFYWQVSGGRFSDGSTATFGGTVTVLWNSNITAGVLAVETQSCTDPANNGRTASAIYKVRSLAGTALTNIAGPSQVSIGATSSVEYRVGRLQYNRAASDPDPYYVQDYIWTVPNGWTITGNGVYPGLDEVYVRITPDNCSGGGITVKAKSNCGNYFSATSSFSVQRSIGIPGAISPAGNVICTSTSPIVYTAGAVTGASTYSWTLPSGWGGSSSTNSITAYPNGQNGGTLSVRANGCSLQSGQRDLVIGLSLYETPPIPGGPALLCTTGTYTLNNAPGGLSVAWSVNPSYTTSPSSGTGTSANLSYASYGNPTISFTLSGCGMNQIFSQTFHAGTYSTDDYPISGPDFATCNQNVFYTMPILPGVTSYNWAWPSEWTYMDGQTTNQLALNTGSFSNYGNAVQGRVNNTCGQGGSYDTQMTMVSGGCGSGFTASPNPSNDELTVTFAEASGSTYNTDSLAQKEVSLYDQRQERVYLVRSSDHKVVIPTKSLPDGPYVLAVVTKSGIESIQVLIEHK